MEVTLDLFRRIDFRASERLGDWGWLTSLVGDGQERLERLPRWNFPNIHLFALFQTMEDRFLIR